MKLRAAGFTLVEVLIAMSITAFVSVLAYASISNVMISAEALRENSDRAFEVTRAWNILSRDLDMFIARPVRDEFGQVEPAVTGGRAARVELSFTRGGWHNPVGHPRSHLQRVDYRLEDGALWRDAYPVLDRAVDTEPESVLLLSGVESFDMLFLGDIAQLGFEPRSSTIDYSNWTSDWVQFSGAPGASLDPPQALRIALQLEDWGDMERTYALPPL